MQVLCTNHQQMYMYTWFIIVIPNKQVLATLCELSTQLVFTNEVVVPWGGLMTRMITQNLYLRASLKKTPCS